MSLLLLFSPQDTGTTLSIQDATCLSTIDNVALAQLHVLIVQDATCSTTLDNVALTQIHILAVQDVICQTVLDNVVLSIPVTLAIQDITIGGEGAQVSPKIVIVDGKIAVLAGGINYIEV